MNNKLNTMVAIALLAGAFGFMFAALAGLVQGHEPAYRIVASLAVTGFATMLMCVPFVGLSLKR